MITFSIEIKKLRRTGTSTIVLAAGILGALYAIANFALRGETMLQLPFPPMNILLTQLYGVLMLFNMFAIIISSCLIYGIEYRDAAIRKIETLPVARESVYLSKFIIICLLLAINIVLQGIAMAYAGVTYLPEGSFELNLLVRYSIYAYLIALPVAALMLLIASRFESMWITLGIGVAGFISGLTMSMQSVPAFLVNPFVLIMKPAMSVSIEVDQAAVCIAFVLLIAFLFIGLTLTKHRHQ